MSKNTAFVCFGVVVTTAIERVGMTVCHVDCGVLLFVQVAGTQMELPLSLT